MILFIDQACFNFLILFRFEMLMYMPYLLYFYRFMLSFSTMLTAASTI